MFVFYLLAFIPVIIGAVLWVKDKEVTWWEWLAGASIGFVMAAIFNVTISASMTSDIETWSGRVTAATFHPRWVEEYQQMHTRTVGSGKNKRTEIYFTTEHRTHHKHWTHETTLGTGLFSAGISESMFNSIVKKFQCPPIKTRARKSGFDSGDPNIYVVRNKSGHVIPVVTTKHWTNRVQASPSVFTFAKVPDYADVYDYPSNPSVWVSGRLLGTAKEVGIYKWDQMNSRLGPTKKVNVIMVGFKPGTDTMAGQWQEAKWTGGKKNDLVITFAGSPGQKPEWVYTFGWTEQEMVKRLIDGYLSEVAIDAAVIPSIEKYVRDHYTIKDWHKFDYLGVEPPGWTYLVFILVLTGAQVGFYFFAHMNDFKTREGW